MRRILGKHLNLHIGNNVALPLGTTGNISLCNHVI